MTKAAFNHKTFSARTSRLFYVFWAGIFLLYILSESWLEIPEYASMIVLVLIVGLSVGARASIAYTRYRITPDFFFIQNIRRSDEFKWENFEGYEVQKSQLIAQVFTSAPPTTLKLHFSDQEGRIQKEVVYNSDPQLMQELDARLSK